MKRYQNNVFLFELLVIGVVLSHYAFLSGCNNPSNLNGDQLEEPWDWADSPALQFTTQDFKLRQKQAIAGDSLSIGFIDIVRPLDSLQGFRQKYANIVTESGDREQVNLFNRPLPNGWIAVYIVVGTKIITAPNDTIIQYNNIVEIITANETIYLIYKQPLLSAQPDTLILTSNVTVNK